MWSHFRMQRSGFFRCRMPFPFLNSSLRMFRTVSVLCLCTPHLLSCTEELLSHDTLFRCDCKMLCVSIQIHFDVSNDFQFSHLLMTILARFSEPPRMTVLCLPVRPCSFLSSTGIHRISQSCGSHGFPLTWRSAAPCLPVLY